MGKKARITNQNLHLIGITWRFSYTRHFWKIHYWISTIIEITPIQSSLASWKNLIYQKGNQHNNYYSSHRARCPKGSAPNSTTDRMLSKLLSTKKASISVTVATSTPKKQGVMPPPVPIEIDEQPPSDLENKINNISSNLSNLDVGLIHATSTGNNKDSMSNSTLVDNRDNDKAKRGRSNNNSLADNRNPAKKLRTVLFVNATMADVAKATSDGHVIDIQSAEGVPDITTDQSDILQEKLSTALFANDDIEQLNFDEPPCFDGTTKLRLICSNSFTKNWVEKTVPELQGLWDNAQLSVSVVGPPPTLFKASFQMPHPTFLPPALFSIINAQNATIDTKFWKYGFRTKVDKGKQTWYIGVDEDSAQALKNIGFRPHVGLGTIKMSVTNKPFEM